jgi:hypothetical protein
MLAPVGGNIGALLLKQPGTMLQIRVPSGVFIAAFATAISAVGGAAGTIVFYQGFALAAAGTSFVFRTITAKLTLSLPDNTPGGKPQSIFVVTVTMSSTEHC